MSSAALGESRKHNERQIRTGSHAKADKAGLAVPVHGVEPRTVSSKHSIANLKHDLERAKARSAQKTAPAPDVAPNDDLERKLQHLVEKYKATKAKFSAELSDLKDQNSALSRAKDDFELKLGSADQENKRLHEDLKAHLNVSENAGSKASARHAEERAGWISERTELRKNAKRLEADLLTARDAAAKAEGLEGEVDRLEEVLELSLRQQAVLRLTTVEEKVLRRVQRENEQLRLSTLRQRGTEDHLRIRLRGVEAGSETLQARLDLAEAGRTAAEEDLAAVLEERQRDRAQPLRPASPVEIVAPLDTGIQAHQEELLSMTTLHADMTEVYQRIKRRNAMGHYRTLFQNHEEVSATLASTRGSLGTLQRSYTASQNDIKGIQTQNGQLHDKATQLEGELSQWRTTHMHVSQELCELKETHVVLEARCKMDRDALKRANDSAMRRQAAEDALEEEVASLRDALSQASQYERLYEEVMEDYRIMATRESLAAEEAERLGVQNAELIGHGNGDQKINYVESVRREMAITKHELASTRHMLNKAHEQIQVLTQENESYKAVGGDLGLGTSTRTRVMRRVPEGSWLGKSTRMSGRSVSGPVGR